MHSAMRSILNKHISIFMRRFLYIIMIAVLFSACGEKKQDNTLPVVEEDRQAKQLLQGIWVNTVDEEPLTPGPSSVEKCWILNT